MLRGIRHTKSVKRPTLTSFQRSIYLIPKTTRNLWSFLSKELTCSHPCFRNITFTAVLKADELETSLEASVVAM